MLWQRLVGERIYLSVIRSDDAEQYARWFHDLQLTAYLGMIGMAYSLEQEQDWASRVVHQFDNKTFAIIVREERRI